MVMPMISIAWPVWLSVVPANTETRSGYPIATASDEFLVRLRYWLVSGGRMTRKACGTTLSQTGQAIEIIAITMGVYLAISLITSAIMNFYGWRISRSAGA